MGARHRQRRFRGLALAGLAGIAIGLRLAFAGRYADEWDAVDFALAVERFDLLAMQPHFPGYPLYVFGARLLLPIAGDPVRALTWFGALAGGLLVVPLYALGRLLGGAFAGWVVALWAAVHPWLWVTALRPMSDSVGLTALFAVVVLALGLACREEQRVWPWGAVGGLFGLAMGIRLSYVPFGFSLAALAWLPWRREPWAAKMRRVAGWGLGFGIGILLWVISVVQLEGGLSAFWALGIAFTAGHFTEWGGTALSGEHGWLARLARIAGYLMGMGVWGWLPFSPQGAAILMDLAAAAGLSAGVAGLIYAARRAWRFGTDATTPRPFLMRFVALRVSREMAVWLLLTLPYALWIWVGQNVDKPRHALPLFPFVMIAGAVALARLSQRVGGGVPHLVRIGIVCAWVLWYAWVGGQAARAYQETPPLVQLARDVAARVEGQLAVVYTWEEARVIRYYAPSVNAVPLRRVSTLMQDVLSRGPGVTVYATNAVLDGFGPDGAAIRRHFRPVARFQGPPGLYPVYHDIVLYRADKGLYGAIQQLAYRWHEQGSAAERGRR
ncbi:MAG TPA: glycosyltransferase family 39 protein [Calditerricola sp.]